MSRHIKQKSSTIFSFDVIEEAAGELEEDEDLHIWQLIDVPHPGWDEEIGDVRLEVVEEEAEEHELLPSPTEQIMPSPKENEGKDEDDDVSELDRSLDAYV